MASPGPAATNRIAQEFQRLTGQTEALAALIADLTTKVPGVTLDPDVARTARAATTAMGLDVESVDPAVAARLSAIGAAILSQSAAFASAPAERAAWSVTDPSVLDGLGTASAGFAGLIADVVAPDLPGLDDALAHGGRILDVGVGVAKLSIAFANRFPHASVVGIDVWQPALVRARENVAAAGLLNRIELREQDVRDLTDLASFDLIWFSGPFVPQEIQAEALQRCAEALRPGGWLVYGAFTGTDDITNALTDLRTLRSGGPVLSQEQIGTALRAAGLADITPKVVNVGLIARVVRGRRPGYG